MRRAAAEALGKIGDPQALPALIEALKDKDSGVREVAAGALREIGPQALPALIEALKDKDSEVRRAAAEALGKIGGPQALPALTEALKDEVRWVRRAAVEALAAVLKRIHPPQDPAPRRSLLRQLAHLRRVAIENGHADLLAAILEREAALRAAASPWRDPLEPPPAPAWMRRIGPWLRGLAWASLAAGAFLGLTLAQAFVERSLESRPVFPLLPRAGGILLLALLALLLQRAADRLREGAIVATIELPFLYRLHCLRCYRVVFHRLWKALKSSVLSVSPRRRKSPR